MAGGSGDETGAGRLTGLQRAFVDAWLGEANFNGVEAARLAGYQTEDYFTLANIASENLKKPKILSAIESYWAAHGITREEVTSTLARHMRADLGDLLDDSGHIDLLIVKKRGDIVKRLTIRDTKFGESIVVELHDAQRAAELIGKTLGMFTERVDVTTGGETLNARLSDEQRIRSAAALVAALAARGDPERDRVPSAVGAGEPAAMAGPAE